MLHGFVTADRHPDINPVEPIPAPLLKDTCAALNSSAGHRNNVTALYTLKKHAKKNLLVP